MISSETAASPVMSGERVHSTHKNPKEPPGSLRKMLKGFFAHGLALWVVLQLNGRFIKLINSACNFYTTYYASAGAGRKFERFGIMFSLVFIISIPPSTLNTPFTNGLTHLYRISEKNILTRRPVHVASKGTQSPGKPWIPRKHMENNIARAMVLKLWDFARLQI